MIRLTRLHTSTIAVLNLFLTLGLLGVYLKFALLNQQWDAVARFLGKVHPRELGVVDRLGFFFEDIALNLLVIPIAATSVLGLTFRRYRVAAAFVVSTALSLAYFVELRAQQNVGQYISREVLRDLIGWAAVHPGAGSDYVTWPSVIKLACLLAALVAIVVIARLAASAEKRQAWRAAECHRLALVVPAVALLASGAGLAAASFAVRIPASLLNGSSVGRAVAALTAPVNDSAPLKPGTFEQALQSSRLRTGTPAFEAEHSFVGRAQGADLLIFMMETGPARALDLRAVGPELPGAGALLDRAFVATRHYSTHPYSSDAMYSILSGLYPPGRRRLLRGSAGSQVNGLMTALDDFPVRGVYVPSLYDIELDDQMYAVFGSRTLYAADARSDDPLRAEAERRADALLQGLEQRGSRFQERARRQLRRRLAADFQTLERVKADIVAAVRANTRYAIMFFPEIGHAPWIGLHGEETVIARGHGLMRLQDAWLEELTDTIASLGRLDRTVIAVTADHGLRTRAEDPALAVGRLSDDMFHVPLLVYAPMALSETVAIENPTSHVDFAPTLLALLGRRTAAAEMQGVPIWQRGARDRVFFFGAAYGGADGFVQDGAYYMRQALSGAVYRHDRFAFADDTQVDPGSPVDSFVSGALAEATHLQQALVSRILLERVGERTVDRP